MADQQQRLPRFTRAPDAAGSFQFTPRDLEILRHVAEHRFIKSEWLIKLVGGSKQQELRRLHCSTITAISTGPHAGRLLP